MSVARRTLIKGPGDEYAIRWRQYIAQQMLDELKAAKEENDSKRIGEFFRVGVVPDFVFQKWLHEGYDCRIEPVAESLKRLRAEYAVFALTDRSI